MKASLKNNDPEIYSTHSEGKSVVTERFFKTWRNKNCKYMTAISKNQYNDKLDHTDDNTIMHTIKQPKCSLLMLNEVRILTKIFEIMIKILNLKVVIM